MDSLISLVGYAALVVTLAGFCLAQDRWLKRLNLWGCSLWGMHFALMEEFVASGMMVLACVLVGAALSGRLRLLAASWWTNLMLIPASMVIALATGAGWITVLPVVAGFAVNTGVARCQGGRMSLVILCGHALWVLASVLMGSPPAILANSLNIAALGVRELQRGLHSRPGVPRFPAPSYPG